VELLLAITVGVLYGTALYLLLRRTLVRMLIGLAILTNAANLLIFTAAGVARGRAPIVPEGQDAPVPPFADPLPQALILTAIVIGFGIQAFAMVLAYRTYQEARSDDPDILRTTDLPDRKAAPLAELEPAGEPIPQPGPEFVEAPGQ
jgi:multicomponent Na+:H+ antiporter subunit C